MCYAWGYDHRQKWAVYAQSSVKGSALEISKLSRT